MISHLDYHERAQKIENDPEFLKLACSLGSIKRDQWEAIIDERKFSRNNVIAALVVPGCDEIIYREYPPEELYDLYLGCYHKRYEFYEYISAQHISIESEESIYNRTNEINFLTIPYGECLLLKEMSDFILSLHKDEIVSKNNKTSA